MVTVRRLFLVFAFLICAGHCFATSIAPPINHEQALEDALKRPFIVYARNYTTPCFADYVPTPEEICDRFAVSMAGDEYEPVQLGLYVPTAQQPATNVHIEVKCDVPLETGYLFYDVDGLKWRPIDKGRAYTRYPGGRHAMPLYLVPGHTIDQISPGNTAAFWITFKVDAATRPGVHKGSVFLSAKGVEAKAIPFELHVYPFELPRPNVVFGMYYRADRIPKYWTRKYQQLYAHDMAAHGMNSGQIVSFFPSFGTEMYESQGRVEPPSGGYWFPWLDLLDQSEQDEGQVDPARLLEAQFNMFQRAGLTSSDIPVWTVQENVQCHGKPLIADTLRRLTIEHGWPEIILQTRDEPPPWSGPGAISAESVAAMLEFKRLENCRTFTALSGPGAAAWGHLHDVWIVLGGHITLEMLAEARRQGAQVWTYLHDLRITNPLANRYYTGLYTWGLGLAGNTPYAYSTYVFEPAPGTPSNDPAWLPDEGKPSIVVGGRPGSRSQVLGFVLPGPDGPIPGVGYEGRREGVDDYRYLQLLESRIAATDPDNQAAVEAKEWVAGLRERIQSAAQRGIFYDHFDGVWELDWYDPSPDLRPAEYQTIREIASRYIVQLPPESPVPPDSPISAENIPSGTASSRQFPPSGWEGAAFDDESLTSCIKALHEGTMVEKRAAASAILFKSTHSMRGAELAACLDALTSALNEPDLRIPALRAIRSLGPKAASTIDALLRQLAADDPYIRCVTLLALEAMGPSAIKGLAQGLSDAFPMNVQLAAESLRRMGKHAVFALDELEEALDSPYAGVRRTVRESIKHIRN